MNLNFITIKEQQHDLTHLKDFSFAVARPREPGKPAVEYIINVIFNLHCIARGVKADDVPGDLITYNGETRCFCPERYKLSIRLPEIVRSFHTRKCRQTGHGNYLTIEVIEENGDRVDYELYFRLTKPGKKQNLKLVIESAYVRLKADPFRSRKRPIGFMVLAYNVKHNRPIRS